MKYLKIFEEFERNYFSTYCEEISAEQYNSWRESWIDGGTFLVWDDDKKSKGFYQKMFGEIDEFSLLSEASISSAMSYAGS